MRTGHGFISVTALDAIEVPLEDGLTVLGVEREPEAAIVAVGFLMAAMVSEARDPEIAMLDDLGVAGTGFAASVTGDRGVGFSEHELVVPASVMKVQIALAVESLIAAGEVDGNERRLLDRRRRTPGPVGISLMHDDVAMSVRDLVVAMLTVSDNAATDELIAIAGLDRINGVTARIGMSFTQIVSSLQDQLDSIARDVGFPNYAAMVAHDPDRDGPPSEEAIRKAVAGSEPLNPARWTRTTAAETVKLLASIWTDTAGPPEVCAAVRDVMARQLTRDRIASGFDSTVSVAAKSGGLLGVVRNEAGVVTFPGGDAYAVAVFTRSAPDVRPEPARIDAAIGVIARSLVDRLRQCG